MSEERIQSTLAHHEKILQEIIDQANIPALRIKEAIQYSLFPGGKRFRPLLVYFTGEIINAPFEALGVISAAIELIHCYSLIHDDLPAMDNDDHRRGKPSCHKAFDEATAILVGDGLQAFALEILLSQLPNYLSTSQVLNISKELVQASGFSGMVSGQSLDLTELAEKTISEEKLISIHQLKTGKLIQAAIKMALYAGNPSLDEKNALFQFGETLGLLFQMQDDYLDHYEYEKLGKNRPSDIVNQKLTFAKLYDKNQLKRKILELHHQALASLETFSEPANSLRYLTNQFLRISS